MNFSSIAKTLDLYFTYKYNFYILRYVIQHNFGQFTLYKPQSDLSKSALHCSVTLHSHNIVRKI